MPESTARYNSFGRFLREKFGCRVYKVSVDARFSCPNRDGTITTGGCIYCNNDSFRPVSADKLQPIGDQVSRGISFLRRRYGAGKFIVYFQPFTNTHAPLQTLIPLYLAALEHKDVVGLSIGTRPDCVDEEKLAWLEELAKTRFVTLEYGLQSMVDSTLVRINRGHTFQCWADAMQRTRGRGIWLGTHLILGFPWESRKQVMETADVLSGSGLNFLKLHQLHVVRGTELARIYQGTPFHLPDLEEYADLLVDFVSRLAPDIYIERLFGTAPAHQLLAPAWGKTATEIRNYIDRKFVERDARQASEVVR